MAEKEYIEREALLAGFNETIYKLRVSAGENAILQAAICFVQNSRDFVASFPAADVVEVRHGRWLFHDTDENDMTIVKCSECGRKRYFGANYCPNCGAKMDGKGEGE